MEKKLYIRLEVMEGEREHTHHCLHEVDREVDNETAAREYASDFWGEPLDDEPDENGWFMQHCGEIAVRYTAVRELMEWEYHFLQELFYGG